MWRTEYSELDRVKKDAAEIWIRGSKIKDLDFLYRFPHLKKLFLRSVKTEDLTPIGSLKGLTTLELTNVGNGGSLEPLSRLDCLEELTLQTPTGWDGSSKTIKYLSLRPLENLNLLKELTLLDVVFDFEGLQPLIKLKSLKQLTTRNKFSTLEFARLAKYKPELQCMYARAYATWENLEYYRCNNCGEMKVEFSGVDLKRRVFCLSCNKAKCDQLIQRYNEIKKDA